MPDARNIQIPDSLPHAFWATPFSGMRGELQLRFARHIKTVGKIPLFSLQLIASHPEANDVISCSLGRAIRGFFG